LSLLRHGAAILHAQLGDDHPAADPLRDAEARSPRDRREAAAADPAGADGSNLAETMRGAPR